MPAILGFLPALGASWWRWPRSAFVFRAKGWPGPRSASVFRAKGWPTGASWWRWAAFRLCLSRQGVASSFSGSCKCSGEDSIVLGTQNIYLKKKNKHVFVCTTYVKIFNMCFEIQIQSLTIVEVTYIFCRIIEIDYVVSLTTLDNACTPDGWLKLNLTG